MITHNGITLDDSERQPCEIWCRVVGYFRPIDSYNIGKRAEFNERIPFKQPSMEVLDAQEA